MRRPQHVRPVPFFHRFRSVFAFLLSLTAAGLVFGGAAIATVHRSGEAGGTVPDIPYSRTEPLSPLPFSLLVWWQSAAHTVDGCTLLTAAAGEPSCRVTAIPRETVLTGGLTEQTLAECCADGTRAAFADGTARLGRQLGLGELRYLVLDAAGRTALLDRLGDNLIFDVPPLETAAPHPASGYQTVSADGIEQLLACPSAAFADGADGRTRLRAELTSALIRQYAVPARADEVSEDFRLLLSAGRCSDLSAADGAAIRDTLQQRRKQGIRCTADTLPGDYVGTADDLRFYPEPPSPAA